MSLPIVFIHKGYSEYLEFSLRQAKHYCPDSEIILLGDESNNQFDFVTHINQKDYFESASRFAKVYKHCSSNSYDYELFCFQRWFILDEYLRVTEKYNAAFVCDSDVLIYSDIDRIARRHWQNCDLGLIIASDRHYSIGISYCTNYVLSKFCRFIYEQYSSPVHFKAIQEVWDSFQRAKTPGGYCDMRSVESFCRSNAGLKLINLIKYCNHATFDFHINLPNCWEKDIYDFKWGRKRFFWKHKVPFCFHRLRNKYAKFHCIHFQGPAKFLMAEFYSAPSFPGITKLKFKFYVLNFMAFWYKILKIRYRFAFLFNYFMAREKQ